jgi:hypothetical protein
MEQFNLTNAERNEQELSEEDLAEVSGGGFLHVIKSIGRGIKSVGEGVGKGVGRALKGDVFVTPGFGNVDTRSMLDWSIWYLVSCVQALLSPFLRTVSRF